MVSGSGSVKGESDGGGPTEELLELDCDELELVPVVDSPELPASCSGDPCSGEELAPEELEELDEESAGVGSLTSPGYGKRFEAGAPGCAEPEDCGLSGVA